MVQDAHILVVDDQPDNLLILEELLGENYAVHPATDAAEALAYLAQGGRADLVLSDIVMPGIDGFELCRRLKADSRTRDIPVLFLSSLDSAVNEERALSVGGADFIHKPFSPPVVLARVSNHLKLTQATHQLRARNADLESFSYSVSHDLRAPLRAINGFAHLVDKSAAGKLDAPERDMLQRVIANSEKLGKMIDDILAYSRAGRQTAQHATVSLEAVARELADELRVEAPTAQIDIGVLPPVRGDEAALRQVLVNLMRNALKFSGMRERPRIEVGASQHGRETIFHVKDNGVGFDMHLADRLFGIFQRLHTEAEFPGTGVGLAIVKRTIENHGGRVWAEAQPDQGATFFFTLTRA